MVCADDAPATPYLRDVSVADTPPVLFVGLLDDIETLGEGGQEGCIDGFAEMFQEGGLFGRGALPRKQGEAAVKGGLDLLAVFAKG